MKKQSIVVVMAALACLGTRVANAQYPPPPYYQPYYPPPPPPPQYQTPPPMAPPPPVYYAPSDSGPFFRLGIGPSFYQNGTLQQFGGPANASVSYDVGFLFDAGIGYAINKYVSLDFDTGYAYAGINSVNSYFTSGSYINNVPFMGEVVFSLPIPHTILVPYIGAGIGGSSSEFYTSQFGNNANGSVYGDAWDTVLAWEGTAGVRFQVSHNFSAGIAYRYFGTGNTTYSYYDYFSNQNFNVGFKGIQSHTVLFTLQWNFW